MLNIIYIYIYIYDRDQTNLYNFNTTQQKCTLCSVTPCSHIQKLDHTGAKTNMLLQDT